jgi:hypothetical protein
MGAPLKILRVLWKAGHLVTNGWQKCTGMINIMM